MKENINIANYEAFYLDYLEGNLNEEMRCAFEIFLSENPTLKIDDDLPNLSQQDEFVLDKSFLSTLHIFDAEAKLDESNCEDFFIAFHEGLLPVTKKNEVQDFLANHTDLQADFELFSKVKLEADLSLTFQDKKNLKRGIIIPMYVKVASIAACLIFMISLFPFQDSGEKITASKPKSHVNKNKKLPKEKIIQVASLPKVENFTVKNTLPETKRTLKENNANILLPKRNLKQLEITKNLEIASLIFENSTYLKTPVEEQTVASLGMNEMKNPVPLVTSKLAELMKRDVDFRTTKAEPKKTRRFFIKIGKLEISRNVYSEDELAIK